MNYEEFKCINKLSANSGRAVRVTIEDRQLKKNICKISGRTVSIDSLVTYVTLQRCYLTNPSLLSQWRGFEDFNPNDEKFYKDVPQKEINTNKQKKEIKKKYPLDEIEKLYQKEDMSNYLNEKCDIPFEVVFKPKDNGPDEVYYYNNKIDAEQHLEMFKDDDSGIYSTIALINSENREVQRVLYFEGLSDICTLDVFKNAIIKLKSTYRADDKMLNTFYYVKKIDNVSCTCEIDCINKGLSMRLRLCVKLSQISIVDTKFNQK